MNATIQQLTKINIFSNLESEILSRLVDTSIVTSYKQGEILIHEGEYFLAKLHVILDGNLLVQKIATSGKETILRQLSSGEMFAAPALFGDCVAPATVTALKDSQIVTIEKTALLEAIQLAPEIAFEILQYFNQRLQEMHQTIHGLISERAVVRLARLIQYTADRYGVEQTRDGSCLNAKLPHQQMARMAGITYEECVRIINKDLSIIVVYERGGIITIKDAPALKAIMV